MIGSFWYMKPPSAIKLHGGMSFAEAFSSFIQDGGDLVNQFLIHILIDAKQALGSKSGDVLGLVLIGSGRDDFLVIIWSFLQNSRKLLVRILEQHAGSGVRQFGQAVDGDAGEAVDGRPAFR